MDPAAPVTLTERRCVCCCAAVLKSVHSGTYFTMSDYFSLSDCDVIGFDLDHTLCRYHLKETSRVSPGPRPITIRGSVKTRMRPAGGVE